MLDFVSQRYGILPSKLLAEGSSIDMIVADCAQGYQNWVREQHELQAKGNVPQGLKTPPKMSVEKMQAMIAKVKGV